MFSVLVVDDDVQIRDILKTFLRSQGYLVSDARNGQQAIEMCKSGKFELFIVDIYMPAKDGITFIEELLKFSPEAKIIAISGGEQCHFFTSTVKLNSAVSKGALVTIQKPFQLEKLLSIMKEIII
ncbi:MAG: response regulator [Candidatus Kuenenia sp.]|nr:response regulator [Candidatus Kuenenia hertensis]